MVQELCETLVEKGHQVTVLTGYPQRYGMSDADQKRTFDPLSDETGVRVVRIKTLPTSKVAYILRGIGQILLPWLFMNALRKYITDPIEAVVVYSPLLPLVKVGNAIKREHNARYILNIQDLFPQCAIDLGILKNYPIIRFFERMEEEAYATADVITTCTHAARKFLIEKKNLSPGKILVVPNWIDLEQYQQPPKRNFREEWKLENDFVFLFPGHFGPSQGLDFVIELAARIKDVSCIKFLFVGDGSDQERLEILSRKVRASNVIFKSFVSPEEYPDLLRVANVGLLSLKLDCKTPAVPGKFFSFLSASLPVLGFLNPESEGHKLVKESQSGLTMIPDDLFQAEQLIRQIMQDQDQFRDKGHLGHQYAKDHFGKIDAINQLEQLLTD